MANSPMFGLAGLIFMAGSLAMLFFIVLAGVHDSTPLNQTYFLQVNTQGIAGASRAGGVSQWTYFYICGEGNTDCSQAKAAYPFGYAWDADANGVPDAILGSHGDGTTSTKYYYLWRFGWVFIILALFFGVITFLTSFLACCGRLGAAIAYYNSLLAVLCHTVAASITTAVFVLAQNAFKNDGRDAQVGKYGFGFLWGSWAALIIACGLFSHGRRSDSSGGRFFGRRGNFEGRRVKDDYS